MASKMASETSKFRSGFGMVGTKWRPFCHYHSKSEHFWMPFEYLPYNFPVMVFWLLWAIYLGFSQCLFLFMLVFSYPLSMYNLFLLGMAQFCVSTILESIYFLSNDVLYVAILTKLFVSLIYLKNIYNHRINISF